MSTIKKRKIILVRKRSPRERHRGVSAPDGQRFWVHHGPIVANLKELLEALHRMSEEQFEHHTSREVNDFAVWASDVLGERALAKKMIKMKSRVDLIKLIEVYIA
ncbi:MAG: hypothetical protein Q7S15_01025 [bacterium]|nr:hypothetical protein [bacterium]